MANVIAITVFAIAVFILANKLQPWFDGLDKRRKQ